MTYHTHNQYDFSKENSIPTFQLQREEIQCPLCKQRIIIPVRPSYIDWEKVAKQYQAYANQMWAECNLVLSEANLDTLIEIKLKAILARCRKALETEH